MSEEEKHPVALLERSDNFLFRTPVVEDGKQIWQLIKDAGTLDLNSSYSYLLWTKYFGDTSVVVESNGQLVGFISGFIQPKAPDTLFVWQVAVDASKRGKGLASRMLQALLHSYACRNIRYLEATVSPSNKASQALFRKLARDFETDCKVTNCFTEEQFPGKGHEAERLFTIGPLQTEK